MIDSHCHLDVDAFDADRLAVIDRARSAGVTGILIPAIRPRTWDTLIELARDEAPLGARPTWDRDASAAPTDSLSTSVTGPTWDRDAAATGERMLRIALGIHPQVVPELDADERVLDVDRLCAAIERAGAIAVGECGLDGGTGEPELQEQLFRIHIRAAKQLQLPLVVHVLRAHDVAPRILREERAAGGVLHSYSGGAELVGVYRDLGFHFSFAGPVTYENAKKPVAAARAVPAELLLAETDAPDQSPAAHRGERCEPAFLPEVIAGLAAARGEPPEIVAATTVANARRLFARW